MELITQLDLLLEYPIIKYSTAIMVVLRVIFKPLFLILGKYTELTVTKEDDKKLHKLMDSKAYKMTAFIVDMLGSVKMPSFKKKDDKIK